MNESERSHPLVKLARESIAARLSGKSPPVIDAGDNAGEPAGAFVSLKKSGQLRGCIGTIEPVRPDLVQEVADNAIAAATRDPRFAPVTLEELDDITISVDVLTRPEPVRSIDELDPEKYGVIVRSGHRKGVLLPDLPGITTAEEQVRIAMQKAGIMESEHVELERFEVKRYY
ncbi:MAG: AmmeMemoRadiSam system protein A [Pseudomonadota bacterium]|jgi:AmmeMemoRadiSam system protein A